MADSTGWQAVFSTIPADVVGIQTTRDGHQALIGVCSSSAVKIETSQLFRGCQRANREASFRVAAQPSNTPGLPGSRGGFPNHRG
jgi:hypothetical protein